MGSDKHGIVIAAKKGRIVYFQTFSYPDIQNNSDCNTQYLIASLTKTFTATVLLKILFDRHSYLQDTEKIKHAVLTDLHRPLRDSFPEQHKCFVDVTLHQLLTHTS